MHMAFNYWFHPPTSMRAGAHERPYADSFWERDWLARGLGVASDERVGVASGDGDAGGGGAGEGAEGSDMQGGAVKRRGNEEELSVSVRASKRSRRK